MEKHGIIRFVREEDKRKIYRITDLGMQVLNLEMTRIKRLYQNMLEVREYDEKRVQVFYGSAMEKGGGIPEAAT